MKREHALYAGSRLYRQAEEASVLVLDECTLLAHPFLQPLRTLFHSDTLFLRSAAECASAASVARVAAEELCRAFDPYLVVPILLQVVAEFYYLREKDSRLAWVGTAAKIATAFTWSNVHLAEKTTSKAISRITGAICTSALFEQLGTALEVLEVYGDGNVEVKGDGLYIHSDRLVEGFAEYRRTFQDRGASFRTVDDTFRALYEHSQDALQAIVEILQGDKPSDKSIFSGTLFEYILQRELSEFWAEIYMFLGLLGISNTTRHHVTDREPGITILEDAPVFVPPGLGNVCQKALLRKFWNSSWYAVRIRGTPSVINNMLVERPILRISLKPCLYATSSVLIMDALNAFVEHSTIDGDRTDGIVLPAYVFQRAMSKDFEIRVCEIFARHNWIAGPVSASGVWHVHDAHTNEDIALKLEHLRDESAPGEVDVLAYNPVTTDLVIAECKVLARPTTVARMKNVISKLGKDDAESFHSKLSRKVQWLSGSLPFRVLPIRDVIGLIVTDRFLPGIVSGGELIFTFDLLEKWLQADGNEI